MRKRKAAVVGLGYVGLPLAVLAQERGWQVFGLDVDKDRVDQINQGKSPLADEQLASDLRKHPIKADTDPAVVESTSIIVIAVPTPVTDGKLPDLKPLKEALTSLRPHLAAGQTLIIESTINPGVIDEVVVPLLKERRDLKLDSDGDASNVLYLAHCPERINPGDKRWTVRNIPRVLGGYSKTGIKNARQFYESILEAPIKVMGSVTEAEAVKILENTFRDINIAFINEMAQSFDKLNIDIIHVIEGAATKPFAFLPHYPGNGVGGHCISVDPYYMIERARQVGFDHQFLRLARTINDSMPAYTLALMEEGLKQLGLSAKTTRVALLGLTYKKNVADLRESPALKVQELLEERGYSLNIFDPYLPERSTVANLDQALANSQVVMLAADHTSLIQGLAPQTLKENGIKLVVDGKNALAADNIAKLGILYRGIGRSRSSSFSNSD